LPVRKRLTFYRTSDGVVVTPRIFVRNRLILLIHGFNEPERKAIKSYSKFGNRLAVAPAVGNDLVDVFWPAGNGRIESSGSYPSVLQVAKATAAALDHHLQEAISPTGYPTRISMIGHSMGCRLALETARALIAKEPQREVDLYLLAAAVPIDYVASGGHLTTAAMFARRKIVFYSRWDLMLGVGFRIGQRLSSDESSSEAVGWRGNPAGFWGLNRLNTRLQHSRYWSNARVARLVRRSLLG
jgi:pimeloyl-ACP methyl ester carboxylesterase